MSDMSPCKHLDYRPDVYGPDIELRTVPMEDKHGQPVRYWRRGPTWTDNGPGEAPNPSNVQFCGQGRGRINGIFQCYNPGEMPCYQPASVPPPPGEVVNDEPRHD